MATPQELYDETKTRLDLNIAKLHSGGYGKEK